jgi:hypothetical protein
MLKKVHNLSASGGSAGAEGTCADPAYGDLPFSESHSRVYLRLRESQLISAEFMDFFDMFAFSLTQR